MAHVVKPHFISTYQHSQYPSISDTHHSLSQTGRTIFITAGGKSIGLSVACSFAIAGAKAIIITGRIQASLSTAKASLLKYGVSIETYACDVTDEAAIQRAFLTTHEKYGPIDVLVKNAGYLSEHVPLASSELADYWAGSETNVKGGLVVTQAFLQHCSPS